MMSIKRPPCIRDLFRFRKKGCPQKSWDGDDGCECWLKQAYDNEDPTKPPIIVEACMDKILFDIEMKKLRLLEGNQQATEKLRNGLCESVGGKTIPKADPAVESLVCALTNLHNRKLLLQ